MIMFFSRFILGKDMKNRLYRFLVIDLSPILMIIRLGIHWSGKSCACTHINVMSFIITSIDLLEEKQ